MGRDLRTWGLIAAAWAARRPEEEAPGAVDLTDMATSPEALLAASLVSAVMPTRGGLDFWGAGHALRDGPAPGLDLDACQDAGREERLHQWHQSDRWQARAMRAVARWRSDGGAPGAEPVWARPLSPLLRAYANGCSSWDVLRVEDDARPGPELAGRLREYRPRGATLAADNPALGDVQAGPPPRDSLVGLPTWRQETTADDSPTDAPPPPAPPGGAKP